MDNQNIDVDAYVELKSIMGDTLNEVIQMYLDSMPEMLESLDTQIQNNNAEQVFELAHRIKSSCSSIGATSLANTAEIIEQIGRQGSTENTASSLDVLRKQFNDIADFLSAELNQ